MTNIEIIKKWVAALRSGKYKQGKDYLCRTNSNNQKQYCCLGVLCDMLNLHKSKHIGYDCFDGYENRLPIQVVDKLGLGIGSSIDDCGVFVIDGEIQSLACLNDKGNSFAVLADIIESKILPRLKVKKTDYILKEVV